MGLAAFSIGTTLVSTAYQYSQASKQAEYQEEIANYNAKVAERNAALRERQANDTQRRGRMMADRRRMETERLEGKQRAALAAQGVDVGGSTPGDIFQGTEEIGELDALTIENNAAREAYGLQIGAIDARSSAQLARVEGEAAATRGRSQQMGTILSGASRAANQANRFGLFTDQPSTT